jgi:hypothetical protein
MSRQVVPRTAVSAIATLAHQAIGKEAETVEVKARELSALCDSHEELEHRATWLVTHVGNPGKCSGCGASIYWMKHAQTGKAAPYDPEGSSHFATCPQAARFKRSA